MKEKQDNQPTLTPPNEWVSAKDNPPQLTGKYICCVEDTHGYMWSIPADYLLEMKTWVGEFGEIKNKVVYWMPLPAPPDKDNHVPAKAPNEPLTLEQLREMDGEPVWVEEINHWALIDIETGGRWSGIPFVVGAENGASFCYNIKARNLHCYRCQPKKKGGHNP